MVVQGGVLQLVAKNEVGLVVADVHHAQVAAIVPAAQGLQQRAHRRDAAAGAQQQQARWQQRRQHEIALGLAQGDHLTGLQLLVQMVRDPPARLALDGDAQGVAADAREAVSALHAPAVDLQAQTHELPGLRATPMRVGAQHEAAAVVRLLHHLQHSGTHLTQRQHRMQAAQAGFHRRPTHHALHQRVVEQAAHGAGQVFGPVRAGGVHEGP